MLPDKLRMVTVYFSEREALAASAIEVCPVSAVRIRICFLAMRILLSYRWGFMDILYLNGEDNHGDLSGLCHTRRKIGGYFGR